MFGEMFHGLMGDMQQAAAKVLVQKLQSRRIANFNKMSSEAQETYVRQVLDITRPLWEAHFEKHGFEPERREKLDAMLLSYMHGVLNTGYADPRPILNDLGMPAIELLIELGLAMAAAEADGTIPNLNA